MSLTICSVFNPPRDPCVMAASSSLLTAIKFIITVYDLLTAWIYSLSSDSEEKVRNP